MSDGDADADRAEVLVKLRRFSDALPLAATAVAKDPSHLRGWCAMARAHIGLRQGQPAVDCGRRALALAPDSAAVHHLLGYAWEVQGSQGPATREAREAVRLNPQGWMYWARLAERLTRDNSHNTGFDRGWEEARHAADQARLLAPDQAEAHVAVAVVAAAAGHREQARASFLKALELDPQNSRVHNDLARLEISGGGSNPVGPTALSRAASGFATAVRADPRSAVSRRNLDLVLDNFLARATWSVWPSAWWCLFVTNHQPGHVNLGLRLVPLAFLALPVGFAASFLFRLDRPVRQYLPVSIRSSWYRLSSVLTATLAAVLVVAAVATLGTVSLVLAIVAVALAVASRVATSQSRRRQRVD